VDIDSVLFLLRLISGALLLLLLGALFVILWRDYRSAADETEASHRTYGRLLVMHEIDGSYAVTGEAYPLLPVTSLGRAPTNSIHIEDNFASSEHARVALRGGQWWLEDRNSRNGTLLNGLPIDQPVIVTDGDIIGIGHKHFRIELEK
jgi:hypothetical protein